jgi:hydrogenase maturation protease
VSATEGRAAPALAATERPRVLVAGIGNVLRGDDGFGPAVVEALRERGAPPGVRLVEFGIGGISLVHELMDGYDVLVILDAVDHAAPPGSLHVIEPRVPDAESLPLLARRGFASDTHEAVPGSALVVARAAGVLPPVVRIVGCQPAETEEFSMALSPAVRGAVPRAVDLVLSLLDTLVPREPVT